MKEFLLYFVVAFVASAVLIFMAKIVLNAIVRRNTGFYESAEIREEQHMLEAAGLAEADRERGNN